jgi:hypothetical protein
MVRHMDFFGSKPNVTWEKVVSFARDLEVAAFHDEVDPKDGSHLVRLVLSFNDEISGRSRAGSREIWRR